MAEEVRAAQKEVEGLKGALAVASANSLVGEATTGPNGGKLLVARLDGVEGKALQVVPPYPPLFFFLYPPFSPLYLL